MIASTYPQAPSREMETFKKRKGQFIYAPLDGGVQKRRPLKKIGKCQFDVCHITPNQSQTYQKIPIPSDPKRVADRCTRMSHPRLLNFKSRFALRRVWLFGGEIRVSMAPRSPPVPESVTCRCRYVELRLASVKNCNKIFYRWKYDDGENWDVKGVLSQTVSQTRRGTTRWNDTERNKT